MRKLEWDILMVLMNGKGLPRTDIEYAVGQKLTIYALSSLCDKDLLRCERHLKSYYYFINEPCIIDTIPDSYKSEAIDHLRSPKKPHCDEATAICRCCLGHLAGRVGVAFRKHLESQSLLVTRDGFYYFTKDFVDVLNRISGTERFSTEIVGKPCLDWTEREYHIGGSLGKEMMNFMLEQCWLHNPNSGNRSRYFTGEGVKQLAKCFDFQVMAYTRSTEAKVVEKISEVGKCKKRESVSKTPALDDPVLK